MMSELIATAVSWGTPTTAGISGGPSISAAPPGLIPCTKTKSPRALSRLVEREETRVGNRYSVDMAADVHPPQPESLHVFELTHRARRVLQRNGTHPRETGPAPHVTMSATNWFMKSVMASAASAASQ